MSRYHKGIIIYYKDYSANPRYLVQVVLANSIDEAQRELINSFNRAYISQYPELLTEQTYARIVEYHREGDGRLIDNWPVHFEYFRDNHILHWEDDDGKIILI